MPATKPDLNDPGFAPIKARLARLHLAYKGDIGTPDDQSIVAHVVGFLYIARTKTGRLRLHEPSRPHT